MPVSVRDARSSPDDREWIRAVYRDYLSELSSSSSSTGMFPVLGEWAEREHEFLAGWFADPGSHPFVILSGGQRAGFALVARPPALQRSQFEYQMAEFFIVPDARRRGVGALAAALLFTRFTGAWEVREDERNRAALQFWRWVIARETSGRYSETRTGGEVRHRFRTEGHPSLRGAG